MTGRLGAAWEQLKRDVLRPARLMVADAGASLIARPWHAVGMISGVLLGVASATGAFVVADTQQAQIDLRFDLQRSSHVVLWAKAAPADGFPPDQVRLVGDLEPVSAVGEFSIWGQSVSVGRGLEPEAASVPEIVADPGGLDASGTTVTAGAPVSLLASSGQLPLAWVGVDLARTLGVAPADPRTPTDSQVIVDGRPFSVAGIVRNDQGFGYVNNAVVIARAAAGEPRGATDVRLVAHVRPGSAAAVAGYAIGTVDYTGSLMLTDQTPPDGQQLQRNVGGDLRQIGAALGGFVGLVGMVAIANTLMLSVNNRLRELGLRSAMGWSRRRIGLLILTESGFAGVIAGILGSALGLAASAIWSWANGWDLIVTPSLPWLVVLAGTAAALLGGLIPAMRAASVSPLAAMRS